MESEEAKSAADVLKRVTCSNCGREVPEQNLSVHSLFCSRNISRCPICDELVQLSDRDEHQLAHTKVQCDLCGERMERSKVENHISEECVLRPLKCEYCEKTFSAILLEKHKNGCPSRLVECEFCHEKIDPDVFELHVTMECRKRTRNCQFCEMPILEIEFEIHLEACGGRTEKCDNCGKYVKKRDLEMHNSTNCQYPIPDDVLGPRSDPFEYVPEHSAECPYCSERFPDYDAVQIHLIDCTVRITTEEAVEDEDFE